MDMTGDRGREDGESDGGWGGAQDRIVFRADPSLNDPARQADLSEQIEQLRAAIAQLSPADQEILNLRHTAGLSFGEIAQALDQPLGTVLARGHRALVKLRKLMEWDGDIDTPGKPS